MAIKSEELAWEQFLKRPALSFPHVADEVNALHVNRIILLTGGGGSIGSALAKRIQQLRPRLLLLLDSSEQNLFRINQALPGREHVAILGSVCDERLLQELFERYRPEIVYHAAAFKHVPLLEDNPFAAIQNNALGTLTLAKIAAQYHVRRLLMISTDKAVNPRSIMGASKRVAELILLAMSSSHPEMKVVRLGNVLGSEGSVLPIFLEQIARGGPVTVTHPEATRYFLTVQEAVASILAAGTISEGSLFFPEMGEPTKIVDLAKHLMACADEPGMAIVYTGLRLGDKLVEDLTSANESSSASAIPGLRSVVSAKASHVEVMDAIGAVRESLRDHNLGEMLRTVRRLVPEYQPSAAITAILPDPVSH
jgi:FlaA1/EpsC-like NDP-sugar epimerase